MDKSCESWEQDRILQMVVQVGTPLRAANACEPSSAEAVRVCGKTLVSKPVCRHGRLFMRHRHSLRSLVRTNFHSIRRPKKEIGTQFTKGENKMHN